MKSQFYDALQKTGNYSPEQIALIVNTSILHKISKNQTILKQGEVCSSCYFIEEGALYQYELNNDLEKSIIDLHINGNWVLNATSFTQRQPSELNIVAYTKSLVYELKINAIHSLLEKYPSFIQLGKILGESSFRTTIFDKKLTPHEKYEYITEHKPELLQAYPLHMIASFLKISPETLSRVRGRTIS